MIPPVAASGDLPKNASAWVAGYYVGYQQDMLSPDQIEWSGLTHIMMSRVKANTDGTLNKDFDIGVTEGPALARQIAQYAHANATKAILMLGGAENGEAILGAVRDHKAAFIANLVATKTDYGYDGYDLDWEDHIDWNLFETFARELREADPNATLTMPVGCININYETVEPRMVNVTRYVDQVNMMSYYPATTWSGDGWESWYVSPLKGAKSTTPVSIEESLARYSAAGVQKSKLGMGIGFHAIGYTNGVTGPDQPTVSNSIVGGDNVYPLSKLFGTNGAYDQTFRHWDPVAFEPYLSLPVPDTFGARYVSFEDEQSIIEKGNFTRANGYGGTIIWTINQGNVRTHSDRNFLMQALKKGFINPTAPMTVAVSTDPKTTYVINGTTALFKALVTGTANKNVTWLVVEPGCGTITADGNYTAPVSATPGVITTCHVRATSIADPAQSATATVNIGDAATLAWDPGLHRTNCAEWWMEVYSDDLNTTSMELQHDGVWTSMSSRPSVGGKPDFAVSVQVKTGDIIRYRATSADGRRATTLPIIYSFTDAGEVINCPIQPVGPDTIPPLSVTRLHATLSQPTYITWSWTDPADEDFARVAVYINNVPNGDVAKGSMCFNATGLIRNTSYSISTRTRDSTGNLNTSWVNDTVTTPLDPDITAPVSVTNLRNITSDTAYITWKWVDPADADFASVQVYIDGTFHSLILKGVQQYTTPLLDPDSSHTISTRTVDIVGNVNQTWVNQTSRTSPRSTTHWVSGYYVGYQQDLLIPDQIEWSGLTHIMMSRVKANTDGTLNKDFDIGEPAGSALARTIAQYAHANNTKAILMLGGAENGEAILGAVRDHRVAFIANLVATKTDYGYDGYDLDWEDHIDWNLFETFARELREADPDAVITMPVGCININYETVEPRMVNVTRYVDQVNMMSYYPATAWAGDGWESWYVSPLKGAKSTTPISIEESLARYSAAGVPKCKLGMGIGFFAMGYLGNVTGPNQPTVRDIIVGGDNAYPLSKLFGTGGVFDQQSRHWDPVAFEPYLSLQKPDSFGARYVSFEDEQSIIEKGNFTRLNGYGGTIIWTINQGNVRTHSDPHFLMHALRKGFIDPDTPLTVGVSVNPPVTFVVAGTDAQFRALVTGTGNRNVTWRIQEPDGGMITPGGFYTAPSDAIPNVTTAYHIIATSRADSTKQATAVVSVGDAATLAWDPGLHRMNCAEWWMEVWAEDANLSALELEHNGVMTPMSKWSDYWGKGYPLPNYAANVYVEPGEIIRYHATRTDGRKATTTPIVYSLTADGETLPCPVETPLAPPIARFTANITHGVPPLTVKFMDTSTGTPTLWNWSFGDGARSNETNPVHTYMVVGNYSISLKVTNSGGSNITTRVNYITVLPSPPSATLYVTNVTGIGRNQTGTTGIYLNNSFNPKVGSATLKLYYNASIITAQSVQIMSGGVVPTNLSSPITLAIATTTGIPNGNAWIANVTFRSEQNAEMISDLGLTLITLDDISIPPLDLIDVTRIQNGTFKTGGGVQVNVIDASGNPMTSDRIALESEMGTMSVMGVNSYRFNAVPAGTYQLNVTKAGYIGVNTTINYAAGSMRVLTATLVTHAYQPTVILAESGVALSGMTRTPPEQLNAKRNETDQYNMTFSGGGVISIALEYPMRYQLNRPHMTSALPVGTEMRNGTFLWTTPFYATTNATLIVTATPVSGQTFVGLKFTGGKLGDVYYDTKVTSTDSLYDLHYVVTNLRSLSTYDYADVTRDGKITSTDALYILHYVVGNVNEYYQAV